MEELEICDGYKDHEGNQYYLGDLVLNPLFGDIWLVDKQINNSECPYCLKLWTSDEEYVIDLNEPYGFLIQYHKNEEKYQELYDECLKILEEHRKMGFLNE